MEEVPRATRRRIGSSPLKNLRRIRKRVSDARQRRNWEKAGTWVAAGTYFDSSVTIGRFTNVAAPSHLGPCDIGSFASIAGRLIVRSSNHSTEFANMQVSAQSEVIGSDTSVAGFGRGRIVVGHGSWIGDSVILLPGSKVGIGSVVGAGSVVTTAIPDFAIAVGNPARVIRKRFSEPVCEYLSRVAWWEWPIDKIKRNRHFFEINFANIDERELENINVLE